MTAGADALMVIPEARSLRYLLRGQLMHAIALPLLAVAAWWLARPALGDGQAFGLSDTAWFWVALAVPIVHQTVVAALWRAQLGWQVLSRWFGARDMVAFGALFFPLLLGRPLTLIALAVADGGTLGLPRVPELVLATALLLPSLYTLYSIQAYFGFERGLGGDHFRARYRTEAFVRRGAFRWAPNAMYLFAFLGLWAIAFYGDSRAALVVAAFQHAYIWVHYLGVERPDMQLIYGRLPSEQGAAASVATHRD